jgi:hypothetical protein
LIPALQGVVFQCSHQKERCNHRSIWGGALALRHDAIGRPSLFQSTKSPIASGYYDARPSNAYSTTSILSDKKSKLTAAAKALVEAAGEETSTITSKQINTMNQNISNLRGDIASIKSMLEEETKAKTLERAAALTHLGSFKYNSSRSDGINSSDLAEKIIEWYSLGYGYNIPGDYYIGHYNDDDKKKKFREQLAEQIGDLIKRKPRIVKDPDGSYVIHYS